MGVNGVHEGKESSFKRMPNTEPPFTLGKIKKAIPPHCFQRSLLRSFSYVVYDLSFSFLFCYIAITYFHLLPSPLAYITWPIYWVLQAAFSLVFGSLLMNVATTPSVTTSGLMTRLA
jgi:omega-6 fatty acid desaturase (delta-12 desaturase)